MWWVFQTSQSGGLPCRCPLSRRVAIWKMDGMFTQLWKWSTNPYSCVFYWSIKGKKYCVSKVLWRYKEAKNKQKLLPATLCWDLVYWRMGRSTRCLSALQVTTNIFSVLRNVDEEKRLEKLYALLKTGQVKIAERVNDQAPTWFVMGKSVRQMKKMS